MGKVKLLSLVALAAVLTAVPCFAAEKKFHAKLTGQEEVPAVKTKASGTAELKLSKDGKELHYKVKVKNIENANAAHIHKGKKGENGGVLANLFTGPKKSGKFSGVLAEGKLTEKDLAEELQGKTFDDLAKVIKEGGAYVNVHTDAHPDGEIRGQLK